MYNTRDIATNIILDITEKEAFNNITLRKVLNQYPNMKIEDKGFITEIVNGTLRNIYYIDYIIEQFSIVKIKKMKPVILNILRITVYQIKFMDKVPDSASCNEAVKLTKKRGYNNLSAFVNGVLRNIVRNKDNVKLPDDYLSILYSHPQWIIDKWLKEYDYKFVEDMCIKNNTSPNVTICTNTLKITSENLKNLLLEQNVNVKDGKYIKEALYLTKTSDISSLNGYNEGYFHVQDESSMLAVDILSPKSNEFIIDVCGAPGGKSLMCAEKMNNKGIILTRDIYNHKLDLIKNSAQRLGIDIIKTQNIDATILDKDSINKADKVLIDAPCSGLGLLRKKPDLKLKKKIDDVEILINLQKKILTVCSEYVKLNGTLVYSTCTISKEENLDNINWFVNNFPFELEDITDLLPNNICSTAKDGYVQLYPNIHDTDGFFIARMRRKV